MNGKTIFKTIFISLLTFVILSLSVQKVNANLHKAEVRIMNEN